MISSQIYPQKCFNHGIYSDKGIIFRFNFDVDLRDQPFEAQ